MYKFRLSLINIDRILQLTLAVLGLTVLNNPLFGD